MVLDLFRNIKKNNNILNIYIIINIIWIFLGVFLYNYVGFTYRSYSTSLVLLFFVNLMFVFLYSIKNNIKFGLIDILLILLVIFGIISCVFSKNISVSLYGYWLRYEGLFHLLYYYSLFYLCSLVTKNKKIIIYFILSFGLINVLVSLLQVFDILSFIPIRLRGIKLAQGLLTNSNFLGSYMVLCLGLSIGLFLDNLNNRFKNILFFVLFIFYYMSLFVSSALSGFVGFIVSLCFIIGLFIYKLINKKINKYIVIKYIILFISLVVVSIVLTLSRKSLILKDFVRFSNETSEIVKGNVSDSYGSSRLYIWKNTLKVVPENLLHGVGIDCFTFAFDGEMLYSVSNNGKIIYYDKVHNDYLQKLVCEGIFSCITYILLLFLLFIRSVKKFFVFDENEIIPLFLAFVGYSVTAFFNISVIEVAPIYFIVLGLLYNRN